MGGGSLNRPAFLSSAVTACTVMVRHMYKGWMSLARKETLIYFWVTWKKDQRCYPCWNLHRKGPTEMEDLVASILRFVIDCCSIWIKVQDSNHILSKFETILVNHKLPLIILCQGGLNITKTENITELEASAKITKEFIFLFYFTAVIQVRYSLYVNNLVYHISR